MLTHTAVSGVPVEGTYSQTLVVGHFFLVLSLSGDHVTLEYGRNYLAKIEDQISQTPDLSPQELVDMHPEGDILVAKIIDQHLSLAGRGEVSAKLRRQNKIINLLSSHSVSGTLLHGDVLALKTTEDESPENPKTASLIIKLQLQEETPPETPSHLPRFRRPNLTFLNSLPRRYLFAAIIVFVTLLCLLVFQLRSKAVESQAQAAREIANQVQDSLSSAQKLVGVNDLLAKTTLVQAKETLVSQANTHFQNNWPKNLLDLQKKLDDQIVLVSKIYSVQPETFYDFGLLKSGAKVNAVSAHNDQVRVLDQGNGSVYSLNLDTKNAAIVSGKDVFKSGKYLDFSGTNVFVWTPNEISAHQTIKSSEKWGKIMALRTFAGNLYLLDATNNQIWKYQGTDTGFSDLATYLKAGSVDFTNVQTMVIDGSVYVLTTTGKIAKFSSGLPDNFTLTGVDPELSTPSDLFASDDTKNLYVLDNGGKRVVVLDKQGNYLSQYQFSDSYSFVAAFEPAKKIFLFKEAKVYFFDLK